MSQYKHLTIEERENIFKMKIIQMRPSEADLRVEIGHWEVDTVIGKRNTSCVVTMADRCSRYYFVENEYRHKYDVVYMPFMAMVPENLASGLAKYVEQGGNLIGTARCGMLGDNG